MVKLDRCSNVLWTTRNGAHHDFQVQPGGNIYALVRKARVIPHLSADKPVLEDFVAVLGASGKEIRRVSLLDALIGSEFAHLWERDKPRTGDVFHTNSLDVLREWSDMGTPGFRPGRVLVSIRKLSLLAVLDMEQERFVWAVKGDFKMQHAAQFLRNGNILLFDNVGLGERSRILELDVTAGESAWEYPGGRRASFYSEFRGQVQRFSSGNTLITETDRGRAFEVNPEGEIVWEFHNPRRAGSEAQFIAALLDVRRLPSAFPTDWIQSCLDS
jgi:hypothetical protein